MLHYITHTTRLERRWGLFRALRNLASYFLPPFCLHGNYDVLVGGVLVGVVGVRRPTRAELRRAAWPWPGRSENAICCDESECNQAGRDEGVRRRGRSVAGARGAGRSLARKRGAARLCSCALFRYVAPARPKGLCAGVCVCVRTCGPASAWVCRNWSVIPRFGPGRPALRRAFVRLVTKGLLRAR